MSLRKKLKMDFPKDDDNSDTDAESKYFKKPENLNNSIIIDNENITKEDSIKNEITTTSLSQTSITNEKDISKTFLNIENQLVLKLRTLTFKNPVAYVYNPLEYAFYTHSLYVNKYCTSHKKILFLGLNPGPWGMSQTGVPFGEVHIVRDWFQIDGPVEKPLKECPSRPITGLECHRSEISGKRFWGLFKSLCGTPENFFKHAFMHNYCPIALMKDNGSNITPADLKDTSNRILQDYCDEALVEIIYLLQVEKVIALGRFAEKRVKEAFKKHKISNVEVIFMLHPSPRVVGNENWHEKAEKALTDLNLIQYFQKN